MRINIRGIANKGELIMITTKTERNFFFLYTKLPTTDALQLLLSNYILKLYDIGHMDNENNSYVQNLMDIL